jgi:hypothetical protein
MWRRRSEVKVRDLLCQKIFAQGESTLLRWNGRRRASNFRLSEIGAKKGREVL